MPGLDTNVLFRGMFTDIAIMLAAIVLLVLHSVVAVVKLRRERREHERTRARLMRQLRSQEGSIDE